MIYTRTPGSASQFDSYRFQLEGAGAEPRWATRPADAEGQAVEFSGLVPGRLYNVTMWTVSHNVTSHPVQRQARLCNYTPPFARRPAARRLRSHCYSFHSSPAHNEAERDGGRRP